MSRFELMAAELIGSTVGMLREALNREARERKWTTEERQETLNAALQVMHLSLADTIRDVSLRIKERAEQQLEVFSANKAVDMWDEIARKWEARQK
jgi:hypothetical protein